MLVAATVTALPAVTAVSATQQVRAASPSVAPSSLARFLVLAEPGAADRAVRSRIAAAGGTVLRANRVVGLYTASGPVTTFRQRVSGGGIVKLVTPDRPIGRVAPMQRSQRLERRVIERSLSGTRAAATDSAAAGTDSSAGATGSRAAATDSAGVVTGGSPALLSVAGETQALLSAPGSSRVGVSAAVGSRARVSGSSRVVAPAPLVSGDPLAGRQWPMRQIRAWQAHQHATGKGVRVGVMDTGIDASHPDLAPRVNVALSRNFTVDDPDLDGPCQQEPDRSCTDPATVDEHGHGTHVAGIIAAARNAHGIVGVAPDAELVNLRVGQDSGYFFLPATVDALTYAADQGVDVVNMSYFIDPWLFNCPDNPADSVVEQQFQATTVEATNRALRYARARGVTLIAAAGNENTDLDNPTVDTTSPNLPADAARERHIDDGCLSMPTEGDGVLAVSAVGPSGVKADYSNWGYRAVAVSAPGGFYRDRPGTPNYQQPGNLVLSAMPKALALAEEGVDPVTGRSSDPFIVSWCPAGVASCLYYQYLQGSSMAAPHAAGVAALIVSRWGRMDRARGGLRLPAGMTERSLLGSARGLACPVGGELDYPDRDDSYTATCRGNSSRNSLYGQGLVDALRAVTRRG